jgi:predicted 2-oxoglutarate/Fe(II)-dependent dioxygenase YbiX
MTDTWTSHPEADQRCSPAVEPVRRDERITRLLHSKNAVPEANRFQRKELQLNIEQADREVSDVCGDSDGASVIRSNQLSVADLRSRAEEQASRQLGRTSEGGITATVKTLRRIRMSDDAEKQVVFVYEDPKAGDPLHAVMRVAACVDRPEFKNVRRQIIDAFSEQFAPT